MKQFKIKGPCCKQRPSSKLFFIPRQEDYNIISEKGNITNVEGDMKMSNDKFFLTYNKQMRKLRNDKHIDCNGSSHKQILVRAGYFNIVNGYKNPFVSGLDLKGNHIYISGTSISQLQAVKYFDDHLRSFLLRYITQVEEEVRTLASYKFDDCNNNGTIPWYDTNAYSPKKTLQEKMAVISQAYNELSKSQLDYVKFYMDNHTQIPTWIMFKVVNFSTFIELLNCSKIDVSHSLCKLYGLEDKNGFCDVKLLIGSLHWLRRVRNSCAHNERVYCLTRQNASRGKTGRIIEKYFSQLSHGYTKDLSQKIFDLLIYFKYYLPPREYKQFIQELKKMLLDLQSKIHPHAFDYVRAQMGIKNLSDLDLLITFHKDEIEYNKFDKIQ
ncbi:MAG: Abi family protein [Blautia sp.]